MCNVCHGCSAKHSRSTIIMMIVSMVIIGVVGDIQSSSTKFSESLFDRLHARSSSKLTINEFKSLLKSLGIVKHQERCHSEGCACGHHHDSPICSHHRDSAVQKGKTNSSGINESELIKLFHKHSPISVENFEQICPAILHSLVPSINSSISLDHKDHSHHHHHHSRVDTKKALVSNTTFKSIMYSCLAVAIICLASVVGIFLFPLLPRSYYAGLTALMSSLAVGTLAGDALLHLIPHAYGLHGHGCCAHGIMLHNHVDHGDAQYLAKTVVIISGIYLFYVVDILMSKIPGGTDATHQHHHHGQQLEQHNRNVDNSRSEELMKSSSTMFHDPPANHEEDNENDTTLEYPNDSSNTRFAGATAGKLPIRQQLVNFFSSVKYVEHYAWVVLIADSIHNVSDGVTIGAAFGVSTELGLTTSLAVLLHELPHELGDYAILISSGFTHLQALFFNLVTAMTAFLGLFLGLALSSHSGTAQQWTLAAAAGIFLYVALVDLFPLLLPSEKTSNWKMLLNNVGLLCGFGIMFLLAAYEDKIKFHI